VFRITREETAKVGRNGFVVTKVMLGVDEHSGILRINIKERLCKILFLRKIILILYRIQVKYNNASKNEYFM